MRAQTVNFERGLKDPTSIGVGKYREMQGLPKSVQETILFLKDSGYWRSSYDKAMSNRTEEGFATDQFFWDYKNADYSFSGAKIEWATLFWLPIKVPQQFYDYYEARDDYYFGESEVDFEASLSIQGINKNSKTAEYYGGHILAEFNLKANEWNSSRDIGNLPDSYGYKGFQNEEDLLKWIKRKIPQLETYIKRFLNKYHEII